MSTSSLDRIRVLRVIARMNVGGPALQVAGLGEELDTERFDQRLLTGTVEAGEADYLELRAPHIEAHRVPGLGRSIRFGGDVRALAALVGEIRRFRPHIVHTHTAKAGVLGRLAAAVARPPATVHTFHGHLLHGYFSRGGTRVVVGMERMLARRTTRLVAVGTRVRDELLDAGIGTPDQYLVVPPGVQLPAPPARGAARRALGLPQGAPVVAFVARFTRVKRPDRFIDVARVLSADHPDIVFVVAGDGAELPATVSAATDAGLGQQIRFLGWRPDVETIYAASDVTVLTSDNEGMPVSLIEAAMSGCPAVTTDVGSAAEVVLDGKTGFVTSPEPIDLARAVSRILADADLRDRLARAAVAHAMERFSRRRLARDLTKLYEELALDKGFACVSS